MNENTYIGIDMGTSGIKLLLLDEERNALAQASRAYQISRPRDGWAEIDPEIWYAAMLEGLEELLEGRDASRVRAIGVTGQMHTLIVLDEAGQSVRPALLWNDKRTKAYIPELRELLASCPDGAYLKGIVSTGSPAANLMWLSREEPESFQRIHRFLIGPDYLVWRLTGTAGTDYCEASTSSLYAPGKRIWLGPVLERIGLSPDACPPIRGSAQTAGTVLPDLARRLGLREDTPVVAGTGDNPATAISTGCLGGGFPVLSLGTSGVLMFPAKDLESVSRGKAILCSLDGKHFDYLVQAVVQATGESISWWTQNVLHDTDHEKLAAQVTPQMIQNEQLLFYPHINGDKTLYADPALRGAFVGLGSDANAAQLYYAVLEGLCYAFRQLIEGVGLPLRSWPSLKAVGGGAKSDLLLQTLSNVLAWPVERLSGNMGPGFGSALLAWACDHGGILPKTSLTTERVFAPQAQYRDLYDRKYQKYLRIHDALKQIEGA